MADKKQARHLSCIACNSSRSMALNDGGNEAVPPDPPAQELPRTSAMKSETSIQPPSRIADLLDTRQAVFIQRSGEFGWRTHVNDHDLDACRLDACSDTGQIRQSLPAKSAAAVTQENQQDWRDRGLVRDGNAVVRSGFSQ